VRRTSELACGTALVLAGLIAVLGDACVHALTDLQPVRDIASEHLGQVIVYVALSVAAFQLDGVFIGTLRTATMRNAAIASLVGFLALSWWLVPAYANDGLWWAFIGYVVLRAAALLAGYPSLRRSIATAHAERPAE
jgi:MATE family multidrug resistance protein